MVLYWNFKNNPLWISRSWWIYSELKNPAQFLVFSHQGCILPKTHGNFLILTCSQTQSTCRRGTSRFLWRCQKHYYVFCDVPQNIYVYDNISAFFRQFFHVWCNIHQNPKSPSSARWPNHVWKTRLITANITKNTGFL